MDDVVVPFLYLRAEMALTPCSALLCLRFWLCGHCCVAGAVTAAKFELGVAATEVWLMAGR